MLERKIVVSEGFGEGFLNCGTSGLNRGKWVKIDGAFVAGQVSGNRTGLARADSIRFSPATSGDGFSTKVGIFNKLLFQRENSDLNLDTVASGEGIIVYFDGWFETDQYDASVSGATIGQLLYLDANSVLATGVAGPARAMFWGFKTTSFDSNYHARAMAYIQVLPQPWITTASGIA